MIYLLMWSYRIYPVVTDSNHGWGVLTITQKGRNWIFLHQIIYVMKNSGPEDRKVRLDQKMYTLSIFFPR